MKRNRLYKWPHWTSERWIISIDPHRWCIGIAFVYRKYRIGVAIGPLNIVFYRSE